MMSINSFVAVEPESDTHTLSPQLGCEIPN